MGVNVGARNAVAGTGVSAGEASGPIYVVPGEATPQASPAPIGRDGLTAALKATADRLESLTSRATAATAAILEAQRMMAIDPALESEINRGLESGKAMTDAVKAAAEMYAQKLERLNDEYLRERASDVRQVAAMVLAELSHDAGPRLRNLTYPSIVVAQSISPADTLSVDPALVLGIVTETGGRTSHAAIVARELGIPAVVGAAGAVAAAHSERWGHIDGGRGELSFLAAEPAAAQTPARKWLNVRRTPVRLMANVSSAPAARAAAEMGAAGVGLFRTEMLFLGRDQPMSEDEQVAVYAAACAAMAPHPVVVRCLDIGSDKPVPYLPAAEGEPNPALGRRGLRLWLVRDELNGPQARALVRVARDHANLEVMFPMVGAPEEMARARASFDTAASSTGGAVPRLGMMVELPAAALALDAFQGLAEFISLGTNDLTQYSLGIDRELAWEPYLSEFSPGVLRIIEIAVTEARKLDLESAVCGELAGTPEGAVFLTGIGIDALSMAPAAMPAVLDTLVNLGAPLCRLAAHAALSARDARSAKDALTRAIAAGGGAG